MDIQLTHGRGGIRIPEYGMAGRSFPSESASESVFSAALDGVGDTGVLIGITVTLSTAGAGISQEVILFITEIITIAAAANAAWSGTSSAV